MSMIPFHKEGNQKKRTGEMKWKKEKNRSLKEVKDGTPTGDLLSRKQAHLWVARVSKST